MADERYISDEEFFASYDPTQYQNPAVAVDVILIDPGLRVKLIRRQNPPQHLKTALPGAFVKPGEKLADACIRAVTRYAPEVDATAVRPVLMEVFDGKGRDIREQVLSVAHIVPVTARHPEWEQLEGALLMDLAFDHARMLLYTLHFLRRRLWDPEVMRGFLPEQFPVSAYCDLASDITHVELDASNFRKKALALGIIEPVTELRQGKQTLYRFSSNSSSY
jgi:8-oxo-dGTP diphosphatase